MPKEWVELKKKVFASLSGKTNPRTKKPYTEEEKYAVAVAAYKKKHGKAPSEKEVLPEFKEEEWDDELTGIDDLNENYEEIDDDSEKESVSAECKHKEYLFSDKIAIKEAEDKEYYVEGYVSSTNLDLGRDIVTSVAQKELVGYMNNESIKLGYVHQEVKGDPRIVPIGITTKEARIDGNKTFARFKLNKKSAFFDEVKGSIEGGYLDAFSVEYYVNDAEYKEFNGERTRLIKSWTIVGNTLTGRPMNKDALITGFYAKDLDFNNDKIKTYTEKKEEKIMVEKKEGESPPEQPPVVDAELKEFKAWKQTKAETEQKEARKAEIKELIDAQVKEHLKTVAPMMVQGKQFDAVECKEVKQFVECLALKPSAKSHSERVEEWSRNLDMQYKAAAGLFNKFSTSDIRSDSFGRLVGATVPKPDGKSWDCVGRRIEAKALTSTTNAEATYYQASAELNDVYDPILYNHLNDETTFFGMLGKVDFSDRSKIQFRAKTVRNSSAAGYLEGATTFTEGNATRVKFEQDFAYYQVIMKVTGQMIADNRGRGGIGDILAEEIRSGAVDLLKKLNQDLLTGTSASSYDGTVANKLLGLQHLCLNTGNLYGKARASVTTLQGNYDAMSSANLTLTQMDKMIRTVRINGAKKGDLVFVAPPLQVDKYKQILRQMQQLPVPSSARAGFEGMPSYDGVPIFEDVDADTDDVFLVDQAVTKLGVQVAPTVEELKMSDYDGKKAFIKIYFNLYAINPNHNYHCSGFATT